MTATSADLQAQLEGAGLPGEIVQELVAQYVETKRRYHLGDHRPTAVEGGRFCEAAIRLLEHELFGSYTPLGKNLPPLNQSRLAQFERSTSAFESLRIHIPRALLFVYGIRNKRNAAHLGDGIDTNLQDATVVVAVLDWVLAEFVRVFHSSTDEEAQAMVNMLVEREVPVVEEVDGQVVFSKQLALGDRVLIVLYRAGKERGLELAQVSEQLRHGNRSNLVRTIKNLDENRGMVLVHPKTGRVHITSRGLREVERRDLLAPEQLA